MEIFIKRRKTCACMKKAQTWAGHCYTDRFNATRHLIVAKTRTHQMPHYNKGHHRITVGRGNDARVKALLKAGGASDTPQSSAPQVRI